jgi:hypothetical protein
VPLRLVLSRSHHGRGTRIFLHLFFKKKIPLEDMVRGKERLLKRHNFERYGWVEALVKVEDKGTST